MLEELKKLSLTDEQIKAIEDLLKTEVDTVTKKLTVSTDGNTDATNSNSSTSVNDTETQKYLDEIANLKAEITKLQTDIDASQPVVKTEAEIALETKQAELDAKTLELAEKERVINAKSLLTESNLPVELADYLTITTENASEVIALITKVLNAFVVSGSYKPNNNNAGSANQTSITKEKFSQMSYADRVKLSETNPTLFKSLSKK